MAVTLNTLSAVDITGSGTGGSGTFTLASGVEYLQLTIGCAKSSGTTAMTLDALTITDGSGNVLTLTSGVTQQNNPINGVTFNVAIAGGKPADAVPSALVAGTCTVDLTYSTNVATGGPDLWVFQLDMGTSASSPFRAVSSIYSDTATDPFTAFADMPLENGGFAIAFAMRSNGSTMTVAGSSTGGAWTQQDDTAFANARASVQYKAVSADYTEVALALDPAVAQRHIGYFFWLKEVNDPAVTAVDTQPATPSEALTVTGTALDVANTGVRLRDVAATARYETLTLSGITSTSLTATMPAMLTEVPFTVGTSQTCEAIATLSGTPSGSAVAVTVDVASGWTVVELGSPNTSASESLAGNLPFTPVALDQIYFDTLSALISVDTTGVVTADVSYVAGTPFTFYGWDASAGSGRWAGPYEAQLTDDGDVVIGTRKSFLMMGVG